MKNLVLAIVMSIVAATPGLVQADIDLIRSNLHNPLVAPLIW